MERTTVKNGLRKGFFAACSLFLCVFSSLAYPIELTELKVRSLLNEPLDAKINILYPKEVKVESLLVSVADRDFYDKQGLEPLDWIYRIDIKTEKNPKTGKIVVRLTTDEPIKDPFADLVIIATWEGGSVAREYTLLLDPPRIAVPQTLAPRQRERERAAASAPASPAEGVGKVASLIKQRSSERRLDRARSRVIRPGGRYAAEEADEDESLWNIANKLVKETPYSVTQGVAALTNKNPEAFKDGNFNSYKSKTTLELPTAHDIASFTEEDAQYFIDAQNEAWEQEYARASEASASEYVHPDRMVDARSDGVKPLRLVAPELEGVPSEALDALKRSQETILQSNQILKDQNANLAELLAQKEKEIELLKSESGFEVEQVNELNQQMPPSAGDYTPHSRSTSVKIAIAWLLVGTILLFSFSIGLVLFREQFENLMQKWKYYVLKGISSQKAPLMEAFASFAEVKRSVSFDIEKALSILSQEEKRYLNLRGKENRPDENAVLEEVNGLIAYEKYGQAKKLLRGILTTNPQNWEAVLKLLELYVTTESYADFETECLTLPFDLGEQSPEIWSKIEVLKGKVNSEKSIKIVKNPIEKS